MQFPGQQACKLNRPINCFDSLLNLNYLLGRLWASYRRLAYCKKNRKRSDWSQQQTQTPCHGLSMWSDVKVITNMQLLTFHNK